jgi:hypothetical protein
MESPLAILLCFALLDVPLPLLLPALDTHASTTIKISNQQSAISNQYINNTTTSINDRIISSRRPLNHLA